MSIAVPVALAASIGNLLQGWDAALISVAVLFIKKEFHLESAIEGLIVAMSFIGATLITTCSGGLADFLGRRPMLIISSVVYFISSLLMLWSPSVYMLLLARLLDGFGIGLAVTLVPLYISEMAPPDIRGLLNTLPQFTGIIGMFLSYSFAFGMSLTNSPSWRLMLGVLSFPSLIYFVLTIFYLPESPRWLVSKGRMLEAKQVLQRLRGREDVSVEMALLVEGLEVGGEISIEEYTMCPAADAQEPTTQRDKIRLYGPQGGGSWVAQPVTGQSTLGFACCQGNIASRHLLLMDPLVTLFCSVYAKLPDIGSMRSMLFPHLGSMFSIAEQQPRNEEWDEESVAREGEDDTSDAAAVDSDDNLRSPLISRQTTSLEKDMVPPAAYGTILSMRQDSQWQGNNGEPVSGLSIGGGWQLAWKWTEREDQDGKKVGGFKRIYLHEEGGPGGDVSTNVEFIRAAALVSQPARFSKELMSQHPVGPAMVHPSETVARGLSWSDLFEPGVKHAIAVGLGIQILQQFSGINAVLYYTPQILEQVGVGVLLSNMEISSASASYIISAITALIMLPCIAVAMRLMDIAGRRNMLLNTIPVLLVSLVILVTGNLVNMGAVAAGIVSVVSLMVYLCCFVMGFGPIPNMLCAEIFPTRVRGLCVAISALAFWIGGIIVTYALPMMLTSIGVSGVFGMYAVVCIISWFFVLFKVPETKGMPLEVISELFSFGAKQVANNS